MGYMDRVFLMTNSKPARAFAVLKSRVLLPVAAVVVCYALAGCSPDQYKTGADREVYEIIESKWQQGHGQKANYTVSDVAPGPNDVSVENSVPKSGVLNLEAVSQLRP